MRSIKSTKRAKFFRQIEGSLNFIAQFTACSAMMAVIFLWTFVAAGIFVS